MDEEKKSLDSQTVIMIECIYMVTTSGQLCLVTHTTSPKVTVSQLHSFCVLLRLGETVVSDKKLDYIRTCMRRLMCVLYDRKDKIRR